MAKIKMERKRTFTFIALLLIAGCAPAKPIVAPPQPPKYETLYQNPDPAPPNSSSKNILVRDKVTAIAIAKAIWIPVYGDKTVQAGTAFDAVLADGVWSVSAYFAAGKVEEGTAMMDISQEDGRISRIRHGQFQPGREWK